MKTWQNPNETAKAAWCCLSTAVMSEEAALNWQVKGGVWYHSRQEEGDGVFYLVRVYATEGWGDRYEHAFLGEAKRIDITSLTLPERRDLLGRKGGAAGSLSLLTACVSKGWGVPVGSAQADKVTGARTGAKREVILLWESTEGKPAETCSKERLKLHYRRWSRLHKQDPDSYVEGFVIGMRRGDLPVAHNRAQQAGWRHGWEYAFGRTPLPEWLKAGGAG